MTLGHYDEFVSSGQVKRGRERSKKQKKRERENEEQAIKHCRKRLNRECPGHCRVGFVSASKFRLLTGSQAAN